jgi:hypothetical protein
MGSSRSGQELATRYHYPPDRQGSGEREFAVTLPVYGRSRIDYWNCPQQELQKIKTGELYPALKLKTTAMGDIMELTI